MAEEDLIFGKNRHFLEESSPPICWNLLQAMMRQER